MSEETKSVLLAVRPERPGMSPLTAASIAAVIKDELEKSNMTIETFESEIIDIFDRKLELSGLIELSEDDKTRLKMIKAVINGLLN